MAGKPGRKSPTSSPTPGFLIYYFLTDRKSSILGVWAAPGEKPAKKVRGFAPNLSGSARGGPDPQNRRSPVGHILKPQGCAGEVGAGDRETPHSSFARGAAATPLCQVLCRSLCGARRPAPKSLQYLARVCPRAEQGNRHKSLCNRWRKSFAVEATLGS